MMVKLASLHKFQAGSDLKYPTGLFGVVMNPVTRIAAATSSSRRTTHASAESFTSTSPCFTESLRSAGGPERPRLLLRSLLDPARLQRPRDDHCPEAAGLRVALHLAEGRQEPEVGLEKMVSYDRSFTFGH